MIKLLIGIPLHACSIRADMVTIHATQKLLNTSGLEAPLNIFQADEGQRLHSWYASLVPTGFQGKMLTIYAHEPSLLTIVCRGKTIKRTWPEFQERLPALLRVYAFNPGFIELESKLTDGYVVSKTNSRSMLGHMKGIIDQLEFMCHKFQRYEEIELRQIEDNIMGWMYPNPNKRYRYITPKEYWKNERLG